jgi:drug/metabolite transporter (DMT)-like permease
LVTISPQPKALSAATRGYIICISGTISWSTTAIFIRYLTETYRLPPLVLAFWRDSFVALALGLVLGLLGRARLPGIRRHLKFLVLYGLILALFNAVWTYSVALNGAAIATVLAYSSAAFTALLGWQFYGERLDYAKGLVVVLCFTGCALVAGVYQAAVWQLNAAGVAVGLLTGLAFAMYSLMGKAASHRVLEPWRATLYAFSLAAAFLLVFNLAPTWLPSLHASAHLGWLGKSVPGWGLLILLAVGPTLGGFGLYTASLTYLPASVANLIATLEPALTAALAYLLLGEQLTGIQLLGSALIVAGVILLHLSEGRVMAAPTA